MSDDDCVLCLCWYMGSGVFNYFLLSLPRRMVVLTCASGKCGRYVATW